MSNELPAFALPAIGARSWRWLAVVFILALLARLSAFAVLRTDRQTGETAHHEHVCIARGLAEGKGFRFNFFGDITRPDLTSQQAPLVPGILAGTYWLCGIETAAAFQAVIILQCMISALTAAAIGLVAWSLADSASQRQRQGWFAGLLAAGYPPLVISALHIQALVWNLCWLSLLLVAVQGLRHRLPFRVLVSGGLFVMAGLGALHTDPILGAGVAGLWVLATWERWRTAPRESRQARGRALLVPWLLAGGILVGCIPWTARNFSVHGKLLFIKSSFWYCFWQGNHEISQGTDKLLVPATAARTIADAGHFWAHQAASTVRLTCVSVNQILTPGQLAHLQSLPNETARMDWFRQQALQQLRADPWHYLFQCGKRLHAWVWFDPTNPRSFIGVYRWLYVGLLLLAVPAVFGLRSDSRTRALWVPMISLTLVHILVITSARFRIPIEMLLIPYGSISITYLFQSSYGFFSSKRPTLASWLNNFPVNHYHLD